MQRRRQAVFLGALATLLGCERPFDTTGLRDPSSCAQTGPKACEAACEAGDGPACLAASVAHTKNRDKMMAYEQKACALDSPQGCYYYANNFKNDTDWDTALEYSDRACNLGWGKACRWLAKAYLLSEDSNAVDDLSKSRAAWEAGCAIDPHLCAGLGDFDALGLGAPRNIEQARAHWKRACDENVTSACVNLSETEDRVWLALPNFPLLNTVKIERLNLDVKGTLPGGEAKNTAGVCFTKASYTPVYSTVIEPSGVPALDAAVEANLAATRAKPKNELPDDRALCTLFETKVRQR